MNREDGRLLAMALAAFLLFLLPGLVGEYGLFIDELYYVACAHRLDLGYVDHPPLAPLLLRASMALLGPVELALRVPPALAGASTVLVTAHLARRLGAGCLGQGLAAASVVASPIFLVLFGYYSMNALEILIWTTCGWILVEIATRDRPRLWLALGVVAGLGLQAKHTFVLFAAALALGLLIAPARRELATRWPWLGLAIAALIAAPNLVWQTSHDWASLEFYRQATQSKNVPTSPLAVLAKQALMMNPATLPVWLAGAVFYLRAPEGRRLRHLGWLFVVLLAAMVLGGQSRPDRIAGVYPIALAAGGAMLERWCRGARRWLRWPLALWWVTWAVLLAPLGAPLLGPDALARHVAALGLDTRIERGEGKSTPLPQWFADRLGWEALIDDVDAAFRRLPADERDDAVIFAPSYGQAGAIELYGPARGLPPAYSTHNNYFLWGPPPGPVRTAIVIGDRREHLRTLFGHVELAGIHRCPMCTRWRDEMPIWIVRAPRAGREVAAIWPRLKSYQ
ncbi:MAG: glycosyltransferase family 39 protein [Nannocystaceae bacterium]